MNIDPIILQAFIAVAQTGSFTKAAEQIGRTQSAISQQMAKLEYWLDKPLLIRGKHLSLTPDGEIFLSYARKIFSLHSELWDRFKKPKLTGEVHFGLPDDFASVFLADVLADFTRLHPSVLLHVSCDFTMNLFSRFKSRELDLVLVKMNRPEDFPNGVNIWSEPLFWVGDPHLLDLKNSPLPLVLSPPPCVYRKNALTALEKANIRWRLAFSGNSYTASMMAVKAGMGITVLPGTMIPEGLNFLDSNDLPLLNDTHVSLLKHYEDNEAINSFESFVLKKISTHDKNP